MDSKKHAALIIGIGPKAPVADEPSDEDVPDTTGSLDAAASDLIAAVHASDASGVKDALRAAFMALEMRPHDEAGEA